MILVPEKPVFVHESDYGTATYDRFVEALYQGCVGHPLRRAHHLEEILPGRNRVLPRYRIMQRL